VAVTTLKAKTIAKREVKTRRGARGLPNASSWIARQQYEEEKKNKIHDESSHEGNMTWFTFIPLSLELGGLGLS
jgi:hypothetical protein